MQKLEDLVIEKVAFVEAGDNKRANIKFFKSKPAEPNTGKNSESNINNNIQKGATDEMKFNKSKMTPEELTAFEELVKKYAVTDPEPKDNGNSGEEGNPEPKAKNKPTEPTNDNNKPTPKPAAKNQPTKPTGGDSDDIYKGLHPDVVKEIKALRKRANEAEERELLSISKKYEILGKKPEELAKTLKSLKDAGGTAYNDMIAILDSSVEAINKSGTFGELGSNGSGNAGGNDTDKWSKIEGVAKEIRKSKPELNHFQAINEACKLHPELVAEYEESIYNN